MTYPLPRAGQDDRAAGHPYVRADVHGLAQHDAGEVEQRRLVRLGLARGVQRLSEIARPRHLLALGLHPGASRVGETVTKRLTLRCPTFGQGFVVAGKHYRPQGRHPAFCPLTFRPGAVPSIKRQVNPVTSSCVASSSKQVAAAGAAP